MQKKEIQVIPAFEVESVPLQYTLAEGTYHKNLSVRKAQHINVCKHAVPFWRMGASWEESLVWMDYRGHG